jgi:hypothetical protein
MNRRLAKSNPVAERGGNYPHGAQRKFVIRALPVERDADTHFSTILIDEWVCGQYPENLRVLKLRTGSLRQQALSS